MEKMKTAYLLLEDGTVYRGYSMGKTGSAVGEVVFNTDMTTYQDLLMDPTYSGQIVVQTYPLIGNRGVDPVTETRLMASGYIVREWCVEPTDAHEFITLDAFLRQQHIVGLCGIDTRALTRHIRNHGVMNGVITDSLDNRESWIEQAKNYRVPPAVGKISVAAPVRYEAENARYELAVPDYGFRRSLLEFLLQRGCSCTVYPAYTPAQELLAAHPDGILLSDGPGDPDDDANIIRVIQELTRCGLPLFGVGLGHQMLALACSMKCVKMEHAHRGANQPVRRLSDGRLMTTNQNHGYAVERSSIDPKVAEVSLEQADDKTVEGLLYKPFDAFTVQFEPSDGSGWQDTAWIFDYFCAMLEKSVRS